jgi:hypothetical protein
MKNYIKDESLLTGSNSNLIMINEDISNITSPKKTTFAKTDILNPLNNLVHSSNNNVIDPNLNVDNHLFNHPFGNFYSNNEFNINVDNNHDDDLISSNNLNPHHEEDENSLLPSDIIEFNFDISDNFFVGRDPFLNKNDTKKTNSSFDLNTFDFRNQIDDSFDFLTCKKLVKSSDVLNLNRNDKNENNEEMFLNNFNLNKINFKSSNNNNNNDTNNNNTNNNNGKNSNDSKNDVIENIAAEFNNCFVQSSFTNAMMINEISKINFDKYFEKLLMDYIDINVINFIFGS